MSAPSVVAPPPGALTDLYAKLSPFQGGDLDLAGALPDGRIKTFLGPLGTASTFTIAAADVAYPDPYAAVTVTGAFTGLGLGTMAATVAFTVAADAKTLEADVQLAGGLRWTWSLAPWLALQGPALEVRVSDSESVPAYGSLGMDAGTGTPAATVALGAPGPSPGTWLLTGGFPSDTSLSHLFELLGGVNIAATLPGPLGDLAALSLEQVAVAYEPGSGKVTYLSARLGTSVVWPLLPGHAADVTSIGIQVTVDDPVGSRAVSWVVTGSIEIGGGEIDVAATYPHPVVTASLEPASTISLSEFVSRFIDHDVDLAASVSTFDLSVELDAPHAYSLSAAIDTDWPIPIPGGGTIDITGLAFAVQGDEAGRTGSINGSAVIGDPSDSAASITVTASATYADAEHGWVFAATQTQGTIPLVQLVGHYLPAGWTPDHASLAFDINDFAVSLTPRTKAYAISGKANANWDILGGIALAASASLAYDGKDYSGAVSATLDEAFGLTDLGLEISYSFDPETTVYALAWNGLSGTYTVPSDQEAHRILEIEVKDWTIGKLIEELVSFATGARFSLAAPWDVLDEIPLDCTLSFDLTSRAISFTYPLSLDLGIAALNGITVTYDKKAKQRVAVQLDGRFPWNASAPTEPLTWDAADPASTPAPPGGGSKYLDVRVLGLGQHVALENPPVTYSVKDIVDAVGELVTPPPDELPVDATKIAYSQSSGWLIATHLGVLKLDEQAKSGSDYFLDVALVFNDPDLYGLHIELEGPAAKIFAGLEFDILYRKITDTIGVYQAQLQLPDAMRQFDVGAFGFTLPTFAIAIYTNGDFELDVGFPWNNDFSRSFTVQGIVPPGIPVIGSGGFYFGKLSAATAGSNVPATTKGTFNPVIVFGVGLQVGVGKTFQKGPFSAGLSVTVLVIVQGVIARYHPNLPAGDDQGGDQLQGPYYFKLQGTAGIAAHLFGSIDFAIVKASVDVSLLVTASFTYESYRAIPITVSASVDVSVTITIDLGLFSIHLHFHFSTSISETFTVGSDAIAPWDDDGALETAAASLEGRRRRLHAARTERLLGAAAGADLTLTWTNLGAPATPLPLTTYCAPAFTVVGDDAATPAEQQGAYVLLLSIASVDPSAGPSSGPDTSFEALAKQVLRWTVAAAQGAPVPAVSVDDLVVSDATLEQILTTLADPANPLPIAPADVDAFLRGNAVVDVTVPTGTGSASATFFPIPPQVQVSVPALGIGPYTIAGFNSYDTGYVAYLQRYFSALDVQVSEEEGGGPPKLAAADDAVQLSVGSFVYADYFTMMARHMVGAARDALRDLKLPVPSGQTIQATVDAINAAGQLDAAHAFTPAQLFEANAAHPLTGGLSVQVAYAAEQGDTLASVAARYAALPSPFTAAQLAAANQSVPGLLAVGTAVAYPGASPHVVAAGETLVAIAAAFGVSVTDLIATSSVTGAALATGVALLLPAAHTTAAGDTLGAIAGAFGVPVTVLGDPVTANASLTGLFALGGTQALQYLDVPHLPQYRLGDLIVEAQQSLAIQQLSGTVGRYFLHGVRLPTDESGTAEKGLFVLTGQQLALGAAPIAGPFEIDLSCPDEVTWVQL